jgi:hypothetical protein
MVNQKGQNHFTDDCEWFFTETLLRLYWDEAALVLNERQPKVMYAVLTVH